MKKTLPKSEKPSGILRQEVSIRAGTPDDIPRMEKYLKESWAMHARRMPDLLDAEKANERGIDAYLKDMTEGRCSFLIAEIDGKLVGFLRLELLKLSEFFKDRKILRVEDAFVAKRFRRKGIASLLTREAETIARENGATRIEADSFAFNKPAQEHLKSMGYLPRYTSYDKRLD